MTDHFDKLDAGECFALGIECAKRDKHGEAIAYLKRGLELDTGNGRMCYFLGAEYAQIGMMDRAAEAMARAVQLEPGLHTASFQLGLLHLSSNRPAEALAAWQPLEALGDRHPLCLFKRGLEALARDEFATCRDLLQRGIQLNTENLPLNGDMQKVLDSLPKAAADGGAEPAPGAPVQGEGNVFLSAYRATDA